MAIFINQNRKIKNIFVNVNGEKKSISSAWVNKDGVPTKIFQIKKNEKEDDIYWEAPENEYINWNYTLDDINNIITLNYYKESSTNISVYANYKIREKTYKTKIASFGDNNTTPQNYMFANNITVDTITFSDNIDMSTCTNISWMFFNCSSLTNLDLSIFDTHNVIAMKNMFSNCSSLTSLDVSNFDMSNTMYITAMFSGCSSLTNIDMSNLNTSNIIDMSSMFSNCSSLTSLDVSNFDTTNVIYMSGMFYGCTFLTSLDLHNFNTTNLLRIDTMFAYCSSLTSLDLRSFNTNKVTHMGSVFKNCRNLKTIYVTNGKWITSNANTTGMFNNCGTSSVTYK